MCQHHPGKKVECRYALQASVITRETFFLASETESQDMRYYLNLEVDGGWAVGEEILAYTVDKVGGLLNVERI